MRHVLISVGCNHYDHLTELAGAENDAESLFNVLTAPQFGDCDASKSVLIKSPNFQTLRTSIIEAASRLDHGDVLTFFFAGHGAAKNGIFYICLSDTRPDQIVATAFPLNSLLLTIQEAAPRHANILIDACNSGGVAGDVKRALSQESVGDTGTTEISLLAACARNQVAYEVEGRGVFTSQVVACIEGTTFVQDNTENLDLADVAGIISQKMATGGEQQPVFWGLNLTGRPNFCRNPHASDDSPLRRVLAEAGPLNLSVELKRALREIHAQLDNSWDPRKLQHSLCEFFEQAALTEESKLNFSNQLLQSLRTKARCATDPFREIEVAATCLAPLLELCARNDQVEAFVVKECLAISDSIIQKAGDLVSELEQDPFALLGETGFGEFYFLPIRISKVLGWLGWAILVRRQLGGPDESELLKKLLQQTNTLYTGSIRSISEAQAPHLVACCAAALGTTAQGEAEEFLGHMFVDACESKALIAAHGLQEENLVPFLVSRATKEESERKFAANPSALVFAALFIGVRFGLDEALDPGFVDMDHVNANAFVPDTYSQFFKVRIDDGYNATIRIGHEAWDTGDIRRITEKLDWPSPETLGVHLLSGACSLVFPDRIAWHLFGWEAPRKEEGSN